MGIFLFLKKHKDKHKADEHKPHPPAPHPPPPPPPPTTASTTSTTSTASTTKSAPIFLKPPCPKNVEYAPPDGNCTFSTGHKLYSKDDFIYQLNSPYRSIGPIDNSEISQKQNSVNKAGGYSSPSFGSNVQSATNGLYRSQTKKFPRNPSSSTGINVNNRNDLVSQSNSPSYRSIRPIDNSKISQKQNSVNNAGGYSTPSFGSNVQSAANGLYRSRTNYSPVNPSTSTGINVNNRNDLVSQSNSPSYRSIDPIDNNEISQKQNSVNNAGGYSSPSFGSNVQSATNGLYRSQTNNFPGNPSSSTGINQNSVNNAGGYSSPSFGSNVQSAANGLYRSRTNNFPGNPSSSTGINVNNRNDLVSQSNSPSYRSIDPIDNNEISQKQNSVNNAGGYSSPSFGSNVQSAANGLYRSKTNNFPGNPSSSTGINVNNQNDLVSQSNSPSYRSIRPIDNSEISQKQNSVNNAGGYSSPSFGSNVQSAANGLYRSRTNNFPGNPSSSTGINQNSVNNAGGYSSPSFGSNVQSAANGLYRSRTNNFPGNPSSSTGINVNNQNDLVSQSNSPSYRSIRPIDNSEYHKSRNSVNNALVATLRLLLAAMFSLQPMDFIEVEPIILLSQSNSPSYRSIRPIDNNEISQKQNSVNNAGGYSSASFGSNVQSATNGLYRSQLNNYPENPISSTGLNLNNKNSLVSQSNSPSYRSIGPIDNSEISQKQNSVNNAGGYSSPSFGSNVQSANNGLYRSRTNYSPFLNQNSPSYRSIRPIDNSEISQKQNSVNTLVATLPLLLAAMSSLQQMGFIENSLVSQSNSPSYRSIHPIDNSEISQKQNSVNSAGGYSSPSFGSNVQSAANGLYRSRTNYSPVNPSTSTGINVNNRNDLVSQSNSPSYRSIGPIDNNEISQKQNSVNNAGEYSSASFGSNVQSATNGLYRISQSNSPLYRSIGPIDNSEISQKQNSVNNAGGYSSASFGSNVQSATNGLYRSQTNNYPENPSSSTGINVNNRNDLVSQSNLPSYRSIRPIDNSEISQKQNSVNSAGGYSSPSFGSNVQSAANGLYRSRTNYSPVNPSATSTGINVNNRNDLVSQSNSPSYRSIGPIDNNEISQKQNSVNNAGEYSSASFGSNVQSATNGLYRSQPNNYPENPISSTGLNLNNKNSLVSQSNSPLYRSIGPIDNSEISQKQNSVNNAGGYSSASFGSNVQSATNGLYRSQTNNYPENPSSSTGINKYHKSRTQLITLVATLSPSFGSNVQSATNGLYRSQPNNFAGNPSSSTGINVNNRNDLISQSNSPSYRSYGPVANLEVSQNQNSLNNAGDYSSPSFGSNVQSATNG
ncbi:unnamed protein product [Lepeophtheirus salmonis]|uniref:(salmon louse) hypothetical protein n=1 Tax=Lepeophtheirus salmonis TaxID=72036 RepID=A0A7R8CSV0_LEPSM|nr:unnamed protein product [Lepeophtheirus salmonis]CAF2882657.1 unnamed protein product [Lepeophtheirus salmonis]